MKMELGNLELSDWSLYSFQMFYSFSEIEIVSAWSFIVLDFVVVIFAIDERIPPPSTVADLFDKVLGNFVVDKRSLFSIASNLTVFCFLLALFVFRTKP